MNKTKQGAWRRAVGRVRALAALGNAVRWKRRALGLTQQVAAKSARVGRRFWQRIEAGEADPRASTVYRIAATLGLHAATLFEVDQ